MSASHSTLRQAAGSSGAVVGRRYDSAMTAQSFAGYLAETLDGIESVVQRILSRETSRRELENLHAGLVRLVEVIDYNPGIDAAADDLYQAARAFVSHHHWANPETDPRWERHLMETLDRLRQRLAAACPGHKARALGLL
jgi:hypothetical protein